jgi:hypothetical protein
MSTPTLVTAWQTDWFCYWDGSFGLPENKGQDFVFKPDLQATEAGLVWSPACPIDDRAGAESLKDRLLAFSRELKEKSIMCSEAGSESDYHYLPFLASFPAGEELTAEALLERVGAHQEITSSVCHYEPSDEERLQKLFGDATAEIMGFLGEKGKPLIFHAGSEKLNPVPFFVVGRLADGLVGGFISAVIHT